LHIIVVLPSPKIKPVFIDIVSPSVILVKH